MTVITCVLRRDSAGVCATSCSRALHIRPRPSCPVRLHRQHPMAPAAVAPPVSAPDSSTQAAPSSSNSAAGSKAARVVTSRENFDSMCTILGGITTSCFRGYVGTWDSFNYPAPAAAQPAVPNAPEEPAAAAAATPPATTSSAAAAAAAGDTAASPVLQAVFVDETVNFRLFRLEDAATSTIHQVNMYQTPGRAAAAYKPYLSSEGGGDGVGRPDGYSLREWWHQPTGALWNPDASGWRAAAAGAVAAAQQTLLALPVHDCAIAFINGGLPSNFEADHTPPSWFMEFIFKQPGSHARRWGVLHRFDHGRLANTKSMNEDWYELPTEELHTRLIDPASIALQPRKQGSLGDIDAWTAGPAPWVSPMGTATHFTYDDAHQLTVQTRPCTWSNVHAGATLGEDATAHTAGGLTKQQQQQQQLVVLLDHPDWSYSRVPLDIAAAAVAAKGANGIPSTAAAREGQSEGGGVAGAPASVRFEVGTVLSNGSLARWLLQYEATGSRLLQSATYELYPAGSSSSNIAA